MKLKIIALCGVFTKFIFIEDGGITQKVVMIFVSLQSCDLM